MKNRLLTFPAILLLAVFLKGLVFSIVVPLWEFPDEQAHFAQVQNTAETGSSIIRGNNLSEEIYKSEEVLGTLRDQRGINKFTYNRDFRHTFSNTLTGPAEASMGAQPVSARTNYVKAEAANYPPLFYLVSSVGYLITSPMDLFTRVFATRMISVFISIVFAYLSWLFSKLIFPKNKSLALSLTLTLSFHPMLSFVFAGVNNDNLLNLASLTLIFLAVCMIKSGPSVKDSLFVLVVSLVGILTKPLIIPVVFGFGLTFLYEWFTSRRNIREQIKLSWPLLAVFSFALIHISYSLIKTGRVQYWPSGDSDSTLTLVDYLKSQLPRYYRETLVWYWGIFKWLGLILPLNLIRIIKIFIGLSLLGIVKLFLTKKSIVDKKIIVSFIIFTVSYITLITLWDFSLVRDIGFSHGLQGRYFFPTIGAHMGILIIGLASLLPKKYLDKPPTLFTVFIMFSHLVSLYTIASSYYDVSTMNTFIIQVSQYKPVFLKGSFAIAILSTYLIVLAALIHQFLQKENLKK